MSGESTHIKEGEVGAATMGWRTPPLGVPLTPIYRRVEHLPHLLHSPSLLLPFSRCSTVASHGLGEALLDSFLHHHHTVVLEFPGGSSTSAARLEQGHGGLHQAERVTEHGCVTSL